MKIGADPYSTPDQYDQEKKLVNTAKKNFRIQCPKCGWYVDRFRLRRHLLNEARMCPRCKTQVEFYKLG